MSRAVNKTSPNGTQGNYFSIIVHGDAIGSHIESIDVFIDGTTHNLLSNESDDEKVLSVWLINSSKALYKYPYLSHSSWSCCP
jgi:hypothetical protein